MDTHSLPRPDHSEESKRRNVLAWLALSAIDGVGYWTLKKLSTFGMTWQGLLDLDSGDAFFATLRDAGGKPQLTAYPTRDWGSVQSHLWAVGEKLLKTLLDRDVTLLLKDDPLFPPQLHEAPDPPAWIFVEGNPRVLSQPSVAIVGTRHPSDDGMYLATYLGHSLPLFGGVTVSGLANGIDQTIHELSLRHGVPTIAVLGTGIFRHFPAGSELLREKIVKRGGAIVSEYLPNQTFSGENFVRRNRIQAALAKLTIPVEWAVRSGTAHTVENTRRMRRPIVCLRLPDWSLERPELAFAASHGAEVITIPGEERRFVATVRRHLASRSTHGQTSLFEESPELDLGNSADDEA